MTPPRKKYWRNLTIGEAEYLVKEAKGCASVELRGRTLKMIGTNNGTKDSTRHRK